MAASGGGGDGEPEFQVAPMIDVLLVLLIFFMSITTAQVLRVDKSIQLPIAANALKKDTTRSEAIVNVRWDNTKKKADYVMDDKLYPVLADLTSAIAAAKKIGDTKITNSAMPAFRVVIRGDRNTTAASISRAMNAAADAGVAEICFSAVNKD